MSKINNQSQITSKYILPDQSQHDSTILSNISATENMTTSVKKVRTSEKEFAFPKEEILQTLTLTNESDFELKNVNIVETISGGATFKTGSVTIDSVPYTEYDIVTGFDLPSSIASQSSKIITYILTIDENPAFDVINTKSTIEYSIDDTINFSDMSNVLSIEIRTQKMVITKSANKIAVASCQTITFENVIRNEGSLKNTNIMFKDILPAETEFIKGTVKVNDEAKYDYDPVQGFELDDLDPGSQVTVKFDVMVK